MKIITAITPNLKDKKLPDCEVIIHEPYEIETYCHDWPINRDFYCTAQGGEFIKWVDYDGLICLIDADTTIQREMTEDELKEIIPVRGEFTACLHRYPAVKLEESKEWLLPVSDVKVNPKYIEICAAMLIAHSDDWRRMKDIYVPMFHKMKKVFRHHAMTQWIISWIIQKHFKLKIGPEWLHNAIWYGGTNAVFVGDKLKVKDKDVVFNHTKWI